MSDHSWKVIGTVATKTLDKSSFLHRGSGIPTDIRNFFSAETLTAGQKIYITLKHSEQAYSAYIEMSRSNRTRIFWSKDFSQLLRNSFSNYYNSLLAGAMPEKSGLSISFKQQHNDLFIIELHQEDASAPTSFRKSILDVFAPELNNPGTRFFIFDTHGGINEHDDIDFSTYSWSPKKFNRVSVGDLLIYRRPSKASENKSFYFFGAGKIESIIQISSDHVKASISKPLPFSIKLFPEDVDNFDWKFRERGSTWERFFNQYGMTSITKSDFVGLLYLAFSQDDDIEESISNATTETQLIQQQLAGNFFVDDAIGFQKRRAGHKVFADKVKLHYNYTCALSGIRAKDFLVASHIIPWSEKKETRLDPSNGICLSVFFDKAFDKGYITITSSYRVKISEYCDPTIAAVLAPYNNKNITLPKTYPPNKEYLQWHNEHIFERFLK